MNALVADDGRVTIESWLSDWEERSLARDVAAGLTREDLKQIPPKHFYDARGSELFERICELPEYYPTRAETSILRARAEEIAELTGACELVELGSGAATKARVLLAAMARAGSLRRYVPLDVSEQVVRAAGAQLVREFDGLTVHGVIGDFERHLPRVPAAPQGCRRLVALLGGTIGNFLPKPRRQLLRGIASLLRDDGDRVLLGTDLVKEPAVLEAAYDDSAGVTAEFNRNLLRVINRELQADFDVEAFEHVAFFDREHEWIEMRLRATRAMTVRIEALDLTVPFAAGEDLRTEISAKFTRERVEADLAAAGLRLERFLLDEERRFALPLAVRA